MRIFSSFPTFCCNNYFAYGVCKFWQRWMPPLKEATSEFVLKQKREHKINRWNFNYSPNRRQLYVSSILDCA